MPITILDALSYQPQQKFERSRRLSIMTDGMIEDVPVVMLDLTSTVYTGQALSLDTDEVPDGADATAVWHKGDRLTKGTLHHIFARLLRPAASHLVPVHLPALPDLDFVGLRAHWISRERPREPLIDYACRIQGSTNATGAYADALQSSLDPLLRIYGSLLREFSVPGAGIESLEREASRTGHTPTARGLALRNAIVAHLRLGHRQRADQLVQAGLSLFPEYAELLYISALLDVYDRRGDQAVPKLIRLARLPTSNLVGSGGENSYRAHWLLAELAHRTGNQMATVYHCVSGIRQQPAFLPSLTLFLKQRIPADSLRMWQWELAFLARRQPEFFKPIFDFFLLHRLPGAAERMLRTSALSPQERVPFEELLAYFSRPGGRPRTDRRPRLLLQGAFLVYSSAARINRRLAASLVGDESFFSMLEPASNGLEPLGSFPEGAAMEKGLYRIVPDQDLTIRNRWPHDFSRPAGGRLAVIVPWEFIGVPQDWVKEIQQNVDELWVPSQFVRDAFHSGGVDADRIQVIPNGVDPCVFKPEGPRFRPEGTRTFAFLFVGGLIRRKGADLVLQAYQRAFTPTDDVTLIFKDIGSSNFYSHMTLLPEIEAQIKAPGVAHMVMVQENLQDEGLAALYRGCQTFVLPYRGEGFGFPIAEAMACGVPVITTGAGPALEFCPAEATCFIPAKPAMVPRESWPSNALTSPLTWFEPDVDALAQAMRDLYQNHALWQERARQSSARIRESHDWNRITSQYRERIRSLMDTPTQRS